VIDEEKLIKAINNSKTKNEAFNTLVNLYKERLYWHIRHMVKSHEDTDDILQNVFIKVHQNISKFKGNSKLYSWMYRIATNESITHINKIAKRLQISNIEVQNLALQNLESDVYFEGDVIQIKLQKAIASLPNKQKMVFNMKYFQELKYSEISTILETSEGALKASYHLASKKIKTYLETH
jgi:RNA polymerase sigma-70 factor (ECF subfamily)